jgi:hypothetical protein
MYTRFVSGVFAPDHTGPLTHKHQIKADGSAETLPLPSIVLAALKIARKMQAERRTEKWPRSTFTRASPWRSSGIAG